MLDRTFLANALPNSTPHWSKLLIPQTNPCRKGPGRCRKSEKKIERDKERDKERHRVRKTCSDPDYFQKYQHAIAYAIHYIT